jgi:hypothetical protein
MKVCAMPMTRMIFSSGRRCLLILLVSLLAAGYSRAVTVPETVVLTDKQVIAFVRDADSGYIFTVDPAGKTGPKHHLDFAAVRALAELITTPEEIWPPLGMPILPPEVGIEFDLGPGKYVLYTTRQFNYFYDHYDKNLPGSMTYLDVPSRESQALQAWREKYFPRPVHSP